MIARQAPAEAERPKIWFELLVLAGLGALLLGGAEVAAQWRQPLRQTVEIDLSVWALPKYALFSLARGWIAYAFSLLFTLLGSIGGSFRAGPAGADRAMVIVRSSAPDDLSSGYPFAPV